MYIVQHDQTNSIYKQGSYADCVREMRWLQFIIDIENVSIVSLLTGRCVSFTL